MANSLLIYQVGNQATLEVTNNANLYQMGVQAVGDRINVLNIYQMGVQVVMSVGAPKPFFQFDVIGS